MRSLSICAFLFTLSPVLAWDFNPKEARTYVDGPSPAHYSLVYGDRKINFRVDGSTKVQGNTKALEIAFTDLANATLKLAQSPLTREKPPFDPKNLPLYQEIAQKTLPRGATQITLLGQSANAFPINNWASYQFTFQFAYYGRSIRSSITFLNYKGEELPSNPSEQSNEGDVIVRTNTHIPADEQWLVEVSSSASDFEKANERAGSVLNTLHETARNFNLEDMPN